MAKLDKTDRKTEPTPAEGGAILGNLGVNKEMSKVERIKEILIEVYRRGFGSATMKVTTGDTSFLCYKAQQIAGLYKLPQPDEKLWGRITQKILTFKSHHSNPQSRAEELTAQIFSEFSKAGYVKLADNQDFPTRYIGRTLSVYQKDMLKIKADGTAWRRVIL